MLQTLVDKAAIEAVLLRYAEVCDRRRWALLTKVFHPDVEVNYGDEYKLSGRDNVLAMIQSMLGGCGPTQHLMGNFRIAVDGDSADCECYVRAAHAGKGERSELFYEVWAEYQDKLVKVDKQWLITERTMRVYHEVGTRDVLAPA